MIILKRAVLIAALTAIVFLMSGCTEIDVKVYYSEPQTTHAQEITSQPDVTEQVEAEGEITVDDDNVEAIVTSVADNLDEVVIESTAPEAVTDGNDDQNIQEDSHDEYVVTEYTLVTTIPDDESEVVIDDLSYDDTVVVDESYDDDTVILDDEDDTVVLYSEVYDYYASVSASSDLISYWWEAVDSDTESPSASEESAAGDESSGSFEDMETSQDSSDIESMSGNSGDENDDSSSDETSGEESEDSESQNEGDSEDSSADNDSEPSDESESTEKLTEIPVNDNQTPWG